MEDGTVTEFRLIMTEIDRPGTIYAVTRDGGLLWYKDAAMNGTWVGRPIQATRSEKDGIVSREYFLEETV